MFSQGAAAKSALASAAQSADKAIAEYNTRIGG